MSELPKLKVPTSFSEIVELVTATSTAVGTSVGNFTRSVYTSLSGNKEVKVNKESFVLHRLSLTFLLFLLK